MTTEERIKELNELAEELETKMTSYSDRLAALEKNLAKLLKEVEELKHENDGR